MTLCTLSLKLLIMEREGGKMMKIVAGESIHLSRVQNLRGCRLIHFDFAVKISRQAIRKVDFAIINPSTASHVSSCGNSRSSHTNHDTDKHVVALYHTV